MLATAKKIPEITGVDPRALPDDVLLSTQPVVLKGLVADWPMVRAGLESNQSAACDTSASSIATRPSAPCSARRTSKAGSSITKT